MNLTTEKEIQDYAVKMRKAYTKDYRAKHPEKVQQWRATAIVNAYKKLISAQPQYTIGGANN